jgi:hypothetical protein
MNLKRREQELIDLNGLPVKSKKSSTGFIVARLLKEIEVEKAELCKVDEDAWFYLQFCVENYILALQVWDKKLEQIALRFCALWYDIFKFSVLKFKQNRN